MKYLSICSGIEAASAAWHQFGWQPIAFAEIEPFPSAVLAHHYPNVPNLGDMTRLPEMILRGEVEAPDLLVGGTPCQAFSVAGLRNSLDDNRGQLSLTFIRIADAIDHVRRTRGESPCIIVWENVPGVLSTSDNAFGCFLGALAGEDGQLEPSGKRWTNAGAVFGPERTIAWRILDAQYFGVAQRRRRVFVVASARDGFNPAEVLFEFDGVRRDTPPSREARQSVATSFAAGARSGSAHAFKVRGGCDGGGKGYLGSDEVAFTLSTLQDQTIHCFDRQQIGGYGNGPVASTLTTRNYKDATDLVAQPIAIQDVRGVEKAQNGKGWNADGTAYTVDTHATQGVAQPIAFAQNQLGEVRTGEVLNTLNTNSNASGRNTPMVAQPIGFNTRQDPDAWQDRTGPVDTHYGTQGVAQPVGVDIDNTNITGDCSGNILAGAQMRSNKGMGVMQPVAFAQNTRDEVREMPYCGALAAEPGMKQTSYIRTAMQVRRLTPTECSRLQGFPDDYLETQYADADEAHAAQILHTLWREAGTPSVEKQEWRTGISAALLTPEILLSGVYGGWLSWALSARCAAARGALPGENFDEEGFVRELRRNAELGCSPYQRESFGQLTRELGRSLSGLPLESAQARAALRGSRLWPQAQRTWPLRYALATRSQVEKGRMNPDGPRYKALGNSMAVPCMAWIGNRINQHDALH